MTRTLVLLHHLMTNADATKINLRHKLMTSPRRFSNALWHMFTVSLGRISYAPPPEWAGPENALRLDQICGTSAPYSTAYSSGTHQHSPTDLAKDTLEVAVDGPELESIWAAFQEDDNVPASDEAQEDEDEDEAPQGTLHSVIEID